MADTLDEIKCPACGKVMKKIYLKEEEFNVDVCTEGCGGIFFDNREYAKLKKDVSNITEITKETEGKDFALTDEAKRRVCPLCGNLMVKNFSSYSNRIQIDTCYNCGGVFLDNKELQEIKSTYKSEKEMNEAMQKRAKKVFEILKEKYNRT